MRHPATMDEARRVGQREGWRQRPSLRRQPLGCEPTRRRMRQPELLHGHYPRDDGTRPLAAGQRQHYRSRLQIIRGSLLADLTRSADSLSGMLKW